MNPKTSALPPRRTERGCVLAALLFLLAMWLSLWTSLAQASVGLDQLPGAGDDGPVTVYYPSADAPNRCGVASSSFRWPRRAPRCAAMAGWW